MEECFKCHTPETKVLLFDVILPRRLDKICGKCSSSVDFPIIKKVSISREKPKVSTVREVLLRISGIEPEERKDAENIKQEEIKLKEIVKRNFSKEFSFDLNLGKELIDNFHWVVMRARRMKHITREQLAKSIQEPNEIIDLIEKGEAPPRREIARKLESFLGISILKTGESKTSEKIHETELIELKKESELDFKNIDDLTISNLQKMENKITKITVAVSGYFDPLHIGHIEYFEKAKKLGDKLIVILNNDHQTRLKKGNSFMPQEERAKIIKSLKSVDEVFISIDEDGSVCKSLELIKPDIFAKGGDRYSHEIPENEICERHDIKIIDGLYEKIQSSSELLREHELK